MGNHTHTEECMNYSVYDEQGNTFQKNSLWRQPKYAHLTVNNLDTMVTMSTLFEHLKNHMQNFIENIYGLKLLEMEIPQSDAARQDSNSTLQERVDRRLVPRGILMYNIDINSDKLHEIATMSEQELSCRGIQYGILSVSERDRRIPCPKPGYSWSRDFNFSLVSLPRWTNFVGTFSVIVDTHQQATEIAKLIKATFPLSKNTAIYARKLIKEPKGDFIPCPYELEAVIPDRIITILKKLTGLTDIVELLRFLQKHSDKTIAMPIDGGDRTRKMVCKYGTDVLLHSTSIDTDSYKQDGRTHVYVVKWEFIVHYMELHSFKVQATYKEPNIFNKNIRYEYYKENPEKFTPKNAEPLPPIGVTITPFSQEINGTTISEQWDFKYSDEDEVRITDGNILKDRYMRLSFDDLVSSEYTREYMHMILDDPRFLDRSRYLNIEVQRIDSASIADYKHKPGNDYEIEIDYEKKEIRDKLSKPGDTVTTALYINKKWLNDWLIEKGVKAQKNMSEYN